MATYKTGTGYDDPEALTRQVQSTAQAMSPAASGNNNLYQAGNNSNTVSHYGQGDLTYNADTGAITRHLNGNSWQVNKGDSKYNDIYSEYVNRYGQPVSNPIPSYQENVVPEYNDISKDESYQEQIRYYQDLIDQMANQKYEPIDVEAQTAKVMTYEEAYELARRIIEPQYQQTYQNTANASAQNLEQSGLYDSLYGQALNAQAQQQVTADMNAAIESLALDLRQMDYDQVVRAVELMINENQYGAGYNQSGLTSAAQGTINLINSLLEQANMQNDFALQQASLQLQQRAQDLERRYIEGQLTQMQYENEMMQLEIEAQRAKNNSTSRVGGSGSGSDNTISGDDSTLRQNILNMITSGNYDDATLRNMISSSGLTVQEQQKLLNMLGNETGTTNVGLGNVGGILLGGQGNAGAVEAEARQRLNRGESSSNVFQYLQGQYNIGNINENQFQNIANRLGI